MQRCFVRKTQEPFSWYWLLCEGASQSGVYELVLKWIMASVSSTGMPSPVIWNPIRWSCSQGISTTYRFIYLQIYTENNIHVYSTDIHWLECIPTQYRNMRSSETCQRKFQHPQNGAGGTKMQLKLTSWCPGTLSCHLFGRFDTHLEGEKSVGLK